MRRHKISRGSSRSAFRRGASNVHERNSGSMFIRRGGGGRI